MKLLKNFNFDILIKSIKMMGNKSKLFLTCIIAFNFICFACLPLSTYGKKGMITAVSDKDIHLFLFSFLLLFLSNAIWWVTAPIFTYLRFLSSKAAIRDIKTNLIGHIVRLPMADLDRKPNGELLSVLSNDTDCLQQIYDWNLQETLGAFLYGFSGIIMLFIVDWRFAFVVLTLGSASVFTSAHFSKKLEDSGNKIQERLAQSSTDAYELIKAAKTIRLLKLFSYKTLQFHKTTAEEAEIKTESGKIKAKMNGIVTGINLLSYLAILGAGALFVYYKLSDWGTVVALTGLKDAADDLFIKFGQFMAGMQNNLAGVKRINNLQNTQEEKFDKRLYRFEKNALPVQLNHIDFAYADACPVYSGMNLSFNKNKLTALTGESGCGKSTVLKLIMALYNPSAGEIIFDGDNTPSLDAVRSLSAYVPQEPMLFRGSIFENIACGWEGCLLEEVVSASKQAGAHEFISRMPDGYDTAVMDDGKGLSGGQKQRIAIARALIKNAPVLLLDEITSALDRETEEKIFDTIREISKTKTVLLVTHYTGIDKIADRVICL